MLKRVSGEKFEQIPWATLDALAWRQKSCTNRPLVRVIRCGTRLLDPTNLRGSFKALEDQLRYAGLIPEDTQEAVDCEIKQLKVKRGQEATYVMIDYPGINELSQTQLSEI